MLYTISQRVLFSILIPHRNVYIEMGITRKGSLTPGTRLSWVHKCVHIVWNRYEENKIKYRGIQ